MTCVAFDRASRNGRVGQPCPAHRRRPSAVNRLDGIGYLTDVDGQLGGGTTSSVEQAGARTTGAAGPGSIEQRRPPPDGSYVYRCAIL